MPSRLLWRAMGGSGITAKAAAGILRRCGTGLLANAVERDSSAEVEKSEVRSAASSHRYRTGALDYPLRAIDRPCAILPACANSCKNCISAPIAPSAPALQSRIRSTSYISCLSTISISTWPHQVTLWKRSQITKVPPASTPRRGPQARRLCVPERQSHAIPHADTRSESLVYFRF